MSRRCPALLAVLILSSSPRIAHADPPVSDLPFPVPSATPPPAAPAPASPPSLADSLSGAAREDYQGAKYLYGSGEYAAARVKLQSAYDASHDPRLLWNIAACEKALHHNAAALSMVRRYQQEGGALLTEADRAEADRLALNLGPYVTRVVVNVNEAGASIAVEGERVGQSPLPGALVLDMGPRAFAVTKPGFTPFAERRNLKGGEIDTVNVTLVSERHEGPLEITASPEDVIRVDGVVVGVGHWKGIVPNGTHGVNVAAPGKRPYTADVTVKNETTPPLLIQLEAEAPAAALAPVAAPPPSPTAKEAHGGGIPTWAWIVGGGVAAAGLGVGAYFLFSPSSPKDPPAGSRGGVAL